MKELIKLLGLKAKATEAELVAAVKALAAHAAQIRSLLGLEATAAHDEVHELLAKVLSAPKPAATGGFAPEAVAAKVSAGLTREQAIDALRRQAEHDANLGNDLEEQGLTHQNDPEPEATASAAPAAPEETASSTASNA